ncbi:YjbQ family protein [Candidatus Bipolaricaulota bacterium]|nr:YjbQ family protein [Candidatus Bipolaricaulota bacterium]
MLETLRIRTEKREQAVDVTEDIQRVVAASRIREGFIIIYVPHDAAAVSIHRTLAEEDAPKLDRMLDAVNPDQEVPQYTKAAFVAPTEVGVIKDGRMVLGDDQRVYFYEFDGPQDRQLFVYVGK